MSLLFVLSGCLASKQTSIITSYEPTQAHDGWEISTPEAENMDEAWLKKAFGLVAGGDKDFRTAKSLLVVRNGKLVAAYHREPSWAYETTNIMSVTKSITSLLVGVAIEKGYVNRNLDTPISTYLPEYFEHHPDKESITVKHLLTMTSGIGYDEYRSSRALLTDDRINNSVDYILGLPVAHPPGAWFAYKSGDTWLLGAILQKVTGMTLEAFAEENLFSALGIHGVVWTMHADGVNNAAFNVFMKPRDLAKVGQLVLQKGRWRNQQLVSEDWIIRSTAGHQHSALGVYGFQWWIIPYFQGFTSNGHGGQYTMIIPDKNLLVVLTAQPYVADYNFGITQRKFDRLLFLLVKAARPQRRQSQ